MSNSFYNIKQSPKFQCGSCDFETKTKTGLRLHKKVLHKTAQKKFWVNTSPICDICSETFSNQKEVFKHMKSHNFKKNKVQ